MRRTAVFLVLPLLFANVTLAQRTVDIAELGKEPVRSDFPSGGQLRMELCASGVRIRSKGGVFRSFERKGPGKYRLHAHVGAGEVVFTQAPSSRPEP